MEVNVLKKVSYGPLAMLTTVIPLVYMLCCMHIQDLISKDKLPKVELLVKGKMLLSFG